MWSIRERDVNMSYISNATAVCKDYEAQPASFFQNIPQFSSFRYFGGRKSSSISHHPPPPFQLLHLQGLSTAYSQRNSNSCAFIRMVLWKQDMLSAYSRRNNNSFAFIGMVLWKHDMLSGYSRRNSNSSTITKMVLWKHDISLSKGLVPLVTSL